MDGILALHEKGPSWGKPKHVGAILASADGVALDHTAARIVGIDPMKVPTIAPAKEREIGENDAGAIEVIGETIEAMRPEDFKLVSNGMMLVMPKPFLDFINHKLLVVRPKWNPDGCKRAGACEKICPVEAITVSPESVAIDFGTCIDCMACVMACPNDGLRVRKGLVAKVLSA
ncbi:MAG: 4Fe-4S binding protein [Deltaproteobacteria bacterium]|nr:4Fe-4S binding protein [Deltaproteobacteria bacterium]